MAAFLNRAGDHLETDKALTAELHAAGIKTLQEMEGYAESAAVGTLASVLRQNSGEVKTAVRGLLHGWTFVRAGRYWVASGPGIEVSAAQKLHAAHGSYVRVNGDAECPSPLDQFQGLACGFYHIDREEGLIALADTIRGIVERNMAPLQCA